MKKLTCKQLGGPCDFEITGSSFEEIGANCRDHVMGLIQAGDEAHVQATAKMRHATREEQQAMMADYKKTYDEAPEL